MFLIFFYDVCMYRFRAVTNKTDASITKFNLKARLASNKIKKEDSAAAGMYMADSPNNPNNPNNPDNPKYLYSFL